MQSRQQGWSNDAIRFRPVTSAVLQWHFGSPTLPSARRRVTNEHLTIHRAHTHFTISGYRGFNMDRAKSWKEFKSGFAIFAIWVLLLTSIVGNWILMMAWK